MALIQQPLTLEIETELQVGPVVAQVRLGQLLGQGVPVILHQSHPRRVIVAAQEVLIIRLTETVEVAVVLLRSEQTETLQVPV